MKKEYLLKNNIRRIRRGILDITQKELADATGCTRQTIVALEKNKYNPSLVLAMRIAKELSVSVEKLFELEEKD
jgi:putative transcriptional regulator